ncbi:exodeoxyribonuclease V subunit alpha [Janthinobacterium fluminis]|uniref:RecBCD enzyme subunit RecD n=1 Tax=Janthinobacterium fluminis TaxID=2987524 RepID=A0ABT5JW75_9BURK|nr:exodeoxyribonuclease V subunit alpha [Janthinobacterium fluminis]MDC8756430.1 exodeoxyribonuclease V subunit alpha [Janthinobacterium fluminis]
MTIDARSAALLAHIDTLTEDGQLRRLSGAFARFIGAVGAAPAPLTLACVVLSELEGRGHSCLMLDELVNDPCLLLGWSDEQWRALAAAAGALPKSVAAWRALLAQADQVWSTGDLDFDQPLALEGARLYLRRYWRDEKLVAEAIGARARDNGRTPELAAVRRWLDTLFDQPTPDGGPDWQKIACAVALRGSVAIITGGPGTGKTYTVASLLTLLFAVSADPERLRIALAAPTGKAAARLKQSIDKALDSLAAKVDAELPELKELAKRMGAARTLHSLLGARPDTRAFQHNAGNPLDVDVLIVDEASMVHLEMMAALLDALPPNAMLVLLGDKDQLASVEAGAVLGDLCHDAQAGGYTAATLAYAQAASGEHIGAAYHGDAGPLAQQTVMLRHSHRFSGPIGALAQAVNAGMSKEALACLTGDSGAKVAWIEPAQQSDVLQLALAGRAGAEGGYRHYLKLVQGGGAGQEHEAWVREVLHSFESFRILCAVRDGEWGVGGLNTAIEQRLESAGLIRRAEWYVGRPVMVTRNDYGTGVFNGDIGLTLRDPARPASLRVYFLEGETVRSVLATRLRHVETAFAMTVHKSQGSEFRHTVLVLPKEGGAMLARELIYTGITRARDYFTLVSPTQTVLVDAIMRRTQRASGLRGLIGG